VKRAALILAVVAVPSLAHADRELVLGVAAGGAVSGPGDPEPNDTAASFVSASARWDRPAPAFSELGDAIKAHRYRFDVVPELTFLAMGDRGATTFGVRLEWDIAERAPAWFWRQDRGTLWIAPRFGAIEDGGAMIGAEFGEDINVGSSSWRIGWSIGAYDWRDDTAPAAVARSTTPTAPHGAKRVGGTIAITISR
jgi:hypothetical protein